MGGAIHAGDVTADVRRTPWGDLVDDQPTARPLAARLHVNRRRVRIVLGVLWILAAGLKFQPDLFGSNFINMIVYPMAQGQPGVVGSSITHMGNFLSHEAALWVTVFGLVELAIGVGLLFRRTVKAALVLSFAWAFGVAWFGEGFGMVLTGHSSPLAIDPSDLQVVEAAIMARQQGLAPVTPPGGTPTYETDTARAATTS